MIQSKFSLPIVNISSLNCILSFVVKGSSTKDVPSHYSETGPRKRKHRQVAWFISARMLYFSRIYTLYDVNILWQDYNLKLIASIVLHSVNIFP
jgi:hypothetical protein